MIDNPEGGMSEGYDPGNYEGYDQDDDHEDDHHNEDQINQEYEKEEEEEENDHHYENTYEQEQTLFDIQAVNTQNRPNNNRPNRPNNNRPNGAGNNRPKQPSGGNNRPKQPNRPNRPNGGGKKPNRPGQGNRPKQPVKQPVKKPVKQPAKQPDKQPEKEKDDYNPFYGQNSFTNEMIDDYFSFSGDGPEFMAQRSAGSRQDLVSLEQEEERDRNMEVSLGEPPKPILEEPSSPSSKMKQLGRMGSQTASKSLQDLQEDKYQKLYARFQATRLGIGSSIERVEKGLGATIGARRANNGNGPIRPVLDNRIPVTNTNIRKIKPNVGKGTDKITPMKYSWQALKIHRLLHPKVPGSQL